MFRLERHRTIKGRKTVELAYGITSLPREQCTAKRLLNLVRSRWGIENRLFGFRDVTLAEDACRVRTGNDAENLANIRNVALATLSKPNQGDHAETIRQLGFHPRKPLELVIKRR